MHQRQRRKATLWTLRQQRVACDLSDHVANQWTRPYAKLLRSQQAQLQRAFHASAVLNSGRRGDARRDSCVLFSLQTINMLMPGLLVASGWWLRRRTLGSGHTILFCSSALVTALASLRQHQNTRNAPVEAMRKVGPSKKARPQQV